MIEFERLSHFRSLFPWSVSISVAYVTQTTVKLNIQINFRFD